MLSAKSRHGKSVCYAEQRSLPREALENPSHPRENTRVIAGTDWVHGQQAARIR